ncbi:MAG: alpha/beta fold hydrolase [Flavobacteriaceae bacterium]
MELLHSRIIGDGKPLIILHGFLGMSDNWKSVGNRYAEHGYQVHLVDQRNHGKSFWSDAFSYRLMTDDLERYVHHYKLDDIILLGHSMGGKTAMLFSSSHPQFVEKLLVADIAPKYYPPHHQLIINALNSVPRDILESRVQADEILAGQIEDPGLRQFLLKSLRWAEKDRLDFRFNLDVLQYKLEAIGEALPMEMTYDKPSMFLRGERSDYITEEDLELIHTHFPAARLETIEKAGHWLHAENPGQFIYKSLEFIKL